MTATANRENRTLGSQRPGGAGRGAAGTGSKAGAEPAEAKKPKKSLFKSKKFLIAVAAVLAIGGGAYTFLKPTPVVPPSGGEVVAMDATTLNLSGGHYLKIAVAIQLVKGKATSDAFSTSHAAELVIDEFSNRTVASLSTNKARKALTQDLLNKIKDAYPEEVFDVFVTQFVTQ
jgi:flagellar protein FliL